MRTMKRLLALAALLCLVAAGPACANVLHAAPSPHGSGNCASASNACTIQTAFASAGDNDEIVLALGTYGSPSPISTQLAMTKAHVYIHGTHGRPRPQIEFADNSDIPMYIAGTADRLEFVGIHNPDVPLLLSGGSTGAQLVVRADGAGSTNYACQVPSGTLIDSVCWNSGDDGAAAATITDFGADVSAAYRNDTLIASGANAMGLTTRAFGGNTAVVHATNVIARGTQFGFHVSGSAPSSSADLYADHSNYSSEFDTGAMNDAFFHPGAGNQTAPPLFVKAAAGNFHEKLGSPTIDHGVNSLANGTTDADDAARVQGAATDIGAFEFTPPPHCSLTPKSDKVSHKGALKVVARCDEDASVTVHGVVKARTTRNGKKETKRFALATVTGHVAANVRKTFSLRLPDKALAALAAGVKESARFKLTAVNAGGSTTATASIKRIGQANKH